MRQRLICALALVLLLAPAAVAEPPAPRLLVLGDSWAFFMGVERSIERALPDHGLAAVRAAHLGIPGSTVEDWSRPEVLRIMAVVFQLLPTIDTAVVSLGGNDFIDDYEAAMTPAEFETMLDAIQADLETLVDGLRAARPGLRVVITGYDYPNFIESLQSLWNEPNRDRWEDAGRPTPPQVNAAISELGYRQFLLAQDRPWAVHLNNFGLMHWIYGYPGRGLAPQTTPLPNGPFDAEYFPGGKPAWPSPPEGMIQLGRLYTDSIHLSRGGYDALAQRLVSLVLAPWLIPAE